MMTRKARTRRRNLIRDLESAGPLFVVCAFLGPSRIAKETVSARTAALAMGEVREMVRRSGFEKGIRLSAQRVSARAVAAALNWPHSCIAPRKIHSRSTPRRSGGIGHRRNGRAASG
jgi:hypothetical protein